MGSKIDSYTNKEMKQARTASELADRLDPSYQATQTSNSKGNTSRKGNLPPRGNLRAGPSSSETNSSNVWRAAPQKPDDLKSYRPPLQQARTAQWAHRGTDSSRPKHNLPGLSGAGMKWYDRHRELGKTHEEALELARTRNKGDSKEAKKGEERETETLKRDLSRESPQEGKKKVKTQHEGDTRQSLGPYPAKKPGLRPGGNKKPWASRQTLAPSGAPKTGPVPASREPEGGTRAELAPSSNQVPGQETGSTAAVDYRKVRVIPVGILPTEYPDQSLTKDDPREIQRFVARRMHKGWKTLIKLGTVHYKAGYVIFDCWDEDSVEWLSTVIKEYPEPLKLKAVRGDDMPKEVMITAYLPQAADLDEDMVLETIQVSNPVNTKSWHMIGCNVAGGGRLLRASISEAEQLKIIGLNCSLHFLFSDVEVSGLRKQKPGQVEPGTEEPGKALDVDKPTVEEAVDQATDGCPSMAIDEEPSSDIGDSEEEDLLEGGSSTPARACTPEAMDSETVPNGDQ